MAVYMGTCDMKIPCIDCPSEICANAGKKSADCPHYHCPTPLLDCETECQFIDRYIEDWRKRVKSGGR